MADYTSIKNIIQEVVKTNNLNEITGANLQMVLLGMINAVDSNNEDDYTLIRQSINTLAQYVDSADNTIRSSIANLLNYVNAQDNDIRSEINSLANSLNSAKFGYNVSVFGLVAGVHTLATAVKNVPSEYRFGGQKITFKTDAGWVTYQNTSLTIGDYEDVDNWVLDSGTTVEGDVTITNNPDYEDLTQNEGGQLKFADKEYNSASYSGLGRVYLRKNIVNGVNTLTQAMMSDANTIYIIQYDYVLGEDITVPANCVLEFEGGSISDGTLINCGNISNISNSPIFKDVVFTEPKEQLICLSWFEYTSFADAFENASLFKHVDCLGEWTIDRPITINNNIELFNGIFKCFNDGVTSVTIASNDISDTIDYEEDFPAGSKVSLLNIDSKYKAALISSDDKWFVDAERDATSGELVLNNSNDAVICNYTAAENIKVIGFNPINVKIKDITFIGTTPSSSGNTILLNIYYAIASVENCVFEGGNISAAFSYCFNSSFDNCKVSKFFPWGIAFSSSRDCKVGNCSMDGGRHGFATLGGKYLVKDCIIYGNTCTNNEQALNTHCSAYNISFVNNICSNTSLTGISVFSPNCNVFNNTLINCGRYPIYFTENGVVNFVIENNIIDGCDEGGAISAIRDYNFTSQIQPDNFIIRNNIARNIKNSFFIAAGIKGLTYKQCIVDGNMISTLRYPAISVVDVTFARITNNCLFSMNPNNIPFINAEMTGNSVVTTATVLLQGNSYVQQGSQQPSYKLKNYYTLIEKLNNWRDNGDKDNVAVYSYELSIPTITSNPTLPNYSTSFVFDGTLNKAKYKKSGTNNWIDLNGYPAVRTKGTTAERPSLSQPDKGYMYIDTDLGKPIWWIGNWVDATGTPV